MYLKPRVIPCLLLEDGKLVKTVKFKNRTYIGDPINAVKIFNEEEADELCLLDISSHKNNAINFDLLKDIASEAFMPLSYGGGIKDIETVKKLFRIGFEKLIFNTAITTDPWLVREAVKFAGAQSIVASVDFKHDLFGNENCYIDCGTHKIKKTAVEQVLEAERLGVGEIFLNSIDKDGTMSGYDYDTIREVCHNTKLPVICCGGAKSLEDMNKAVHECGTQAVAAGSLFIFYGPRRAVLINYPSESEQKILFNK